MDTKLSSVGDLLKLLTKSGLRPVLSVEYIILDGLALYEVTVIDRNRKVEHPYGSQDLYHILASAKEADLDFALELVEVELLSSDEMLVILKN